MPGIKDYPESRLENAPFSHTASSYLNVTLQAMVLHNKVEKYLQNFINLFQIDEYD